MGLFISRLMVLMVIAASGSGVYAAVFIYGETCLCCRVDIYRSGRICHGRSWRPLRRHRSTFQTGAHHLLATQRPSVTFLASSQPSNWCLTSLSVAFGPVFHPSTIHSASIQARLADATMTTWSDQAHQSMTMPTSRSNMCVPTQLVGPCRLHRRRRAWFMQTEAAQPRGFQHLPLSSQVQ